MAPDIMVLYFQCTTLHPRLAILTETLSTVLDDLFHAFLLYAMLMLLMAAMANWRFGDSRDDFESLGHALGTQVQMMLGGDFPADWQQDAEMTIWTLVFFILLMVFMLNFLLAIIVDGYVKVAKALEEQETEGNFFSDVAASIHSAYLRWANGWPNLRLLAEWMVDSLHERSVCFQDLQQRMPRELAFGRAASRSAVSPAEAETADSEGAHLKRRQGHDGEGKGRQVSIVAFIRHYGMFDCLLEPDEGDKLFEQILQAAHGRVDLSGTMSKGKEQIAAARLLFRKKTVAASSSLLSAMGSSKHVQRVMDGDGYEASASHGGKLDLKQEESTVVHRLASTSVHAIVPATAPASRVTADSDLSFNADDGLPEDSAKPLDDLDQILQQVEQGQASNSTPTGISIGASFGLLADDEFQGREKAAHLSGSPARRSSPDLHHG